MELIKIILPIIMSFLYLLYYIFLYRKKYDIDFFSFFIVALAPYYSSNFSLTIYRPALQIIVIIGFIILIINFLLKKKILIINKYEILFLISIIISGLFVTFNNFFLLGLINFVYILLILILLRSNILIDNINIYINLIIVNGVIFSVFSIIEFILSGSRTEVVFSNPNYLGFYLVFSFILYLYFYNIKLNFYRLLILCSIALGTYFTDSDSILIILVLSVLLKMKIKYKVMIKAIPLFLIIIISLLLLNRDYLLSNIGYLLDGSNAQRIGIWSMAFEGFLDNLLVGVGYNNFPLYFIENKYFYHNYLYLSSFFQYDYFVTHNDFIRIMVELGLLGIIIFIVYISKLISFSLKIPNKNIRDMNILIIITVLVFIFTHNNINAYDTWWMLGFSLFFIKNNILIKLV